MFNLHYIIASVFTGEYLTIPRLVGTVFATLTAVDFDGKRSVIGGDPVTVILTGPLECTQQEKTECSLNCHQENKSSDCLCVIDHKNGQYTISLRLSNCGRYLPTNIKLMKSK